MAKKIGVAALVLLILIGLALGISWRRLTALPDWYADLAMLSEDGSPQVDQDWVLIPHGEPNAGGYVLRNPHLRAEPEPGKRKPPIQKAIKRSRAIYEQGAVDAGAVINLSQMDLDALSSKDRAQYEKTIDAFPALTGRDVYVGIEGGVDHDGKLVLGRETKLRIGDTRYSLATAARRLGMTEQQLRAEIEKELAGIEVPRPPEGG